MKIYGQQTGSDFYPHNFQNNSSLNQPFDQVQQHSPKRASHVTSRDTFDHMMPDINMHKMITEESV